MSDHRRATRINARLWIQVAGVDSEPLLRRGDISVTGMFFEADQEVGVPGSVQAIRIGTFDKVHWLEVLGRVVRVVTADDLWRGRTVSGIGMEFMAEDRVKREALRAMLKSLAGTRPLSGRLNTGSFLLLRGDDHEDPSTLVLESIDNDGMVLESTWQVLVGETIRCEIQAPASGRALRIEGAATQVDEVGSSTPRYRVQVKFRGTRPVTRPQPQEADIEGPSLDAAMSVLLEETQFGVPPEHGRNFEIKQDLTGTLDRIQLGALLSFIQIESLTGTLTIERDGKETGIVLSEGRVFTVRREGSTDAAMDLLAELLGWHEGKFSFASHDVEATDELGMSTTALLMELARRGDESGR